MMLEAAQLVMIAAGGLHSVDDQLILDWAAHNWLDPASQSERERVELVKRIPKMERGLN